MTNPPPAAFAFSWNLASMAEKTDSAYFGTFDLNLSHVPAGVMWSVVMLSPSFMSTLPLRLSGSAPCFGSSFMLGPRTILTSDGSLAGGTTIESSTRNFAGSFTFGYFPSFLGSVMTPYIAAATAVSGLDRYTLSSSVPLLPGKFLGNVLTETVPVEG